jgi:hypothetical protein
MVACAMKMMVHKHYSIGRTDPDTPVAEPLDLEPNALRQSDQGFAGKALVERRAHVGRSAPVRSAGTAIFLVIRGRPMVEGPSTNFTTACYTNGYPSF